MTLSPRRQTALYAVLLFAAGLLYRATFIGQSFNASDEAFLPGLALRVLKGQLIYRDFIYASPPLTVIKEAGVAAALGSNYSFLASRWVFAVEVSAGSVLAFLIISRFMPPLVAFLATLPTVFFTTVVYAYSNFNFDAQVLFLLGFLLIVWECGRAQASTLAGESGKAQSSPLAGEVDGEAGRRGRATGHNRAERRAILLLAGVLCGMAFLAKPTYLAMGVGICGLGILRPWMGGPRRWPYFAIGFAGVIGLVFAAIAALGLWADFRHQAFGLLLAAAPRSTRFYLIQDWPLYLRPPGTSALPVIAAAILLPLARLRTWIALPALVVFAALLAILVVPALPSSMVGSPTNPQRYLLVGGLALILAVNLVASVVTLAARLPRMASRPWAARVREELFPPFIPIVAVVLEYLHGIDLSTMRFAYIGTFLGIPVALTFLYVGWRLWGGPEIVRIAVPAVAGVFIVLAGAVVTHGAPYLDGPRDQLTGSFTASKLAGISTTQANERHVDGLVAAIEAGTQPGDATLVFPDGQAYYVITGRHNPTRLDWYNLLATTPAMSAEALNTLKLNPPKVVFLQEYRESDIRHRCPLIPGPGHRHSGCPRTFDREPAWRPIYQFITTNYDLVGEVEGVRIYRLR